MKHCFFHMKKHEKYGENIAVRKKRKSSSPEKAKSPKKLKKEITTRSARFGLGPDVPERRADHQLRGPACVGVGRGRPGQGDAVQGLPQAGLRSLRPLPRQETVRRAGEAQETLQEEKVRVAEGNKNNKK